MDKLMKQVEVQALKVEWTMTHGFFAWMGGSMLYVNGKSRATHTTHELQCFFHDVFVDMPVM
ncbi:hypothetical protein BDR05DRAFT_1006678 [Suillus weaverae]|nr:hypothetical protein BDR05DRAFT_1006678 [Suillus weaverae]